MTKRITLPLKWHGGKFYLAKKIVALMPEHLNYVEPYFGGGAVLFAKNPEGTSEIVNDINSTLINFWNVLRVTEDFQRFRRACGATPFSDLMWTEANKHILQSGDSKESFLAQDQVRWAWMFFIRCRQSLSGRMKSFTGITKTRVRRGMNNEVSAWLTAVEGLPEVHARLKRVLILNRKALDVIQEFNHKHTLFYLDPPYLSETRTSPDVYDYEMTKDDHTELLDLLVRHGLKGKFMISGYRSDLYDRLLNAWNRHEFDLPNNSSSSKKKERKIECVWTNF